MKTMVCKIAGLYIKFDYEYDLIHELSEKYIVDNYDHIDICLNNKNIDKYKDDNRIEAAEVLCFLGDLADLLVNYNKILVHGASIEYKDKAYLFMAPSGTGKSTHIKYWKQALNDVHIINGDKPIIDENGYVYGTPWAGKERWNNPISHKLNSLIFIHRDTYNHIEKIDCKDCLDELLNGIYVPNNNINLTLTLINKIFSNVNIYRMYCTNDVSAAEVCIQEILD